MTAFERFILKGMIQFLRICLTYLSMKYVEMSNATGSVHLIPNINNKLISSVEDLDKDIQEAI